MYRAFLCGVSVVLLSATPAAASTIFFDNFSPQQPGWSLAANPAGYMGPLHNFYTPGSVTLTLNGVAADPLGILEFDLLIFDTLDHDNCCTDVFTMSANSGTLFTGAFSGAPFSPVVAPPGGAGFQTSHFFTNPAGATTVQLGPGAFAVGTLNGFGLTSAWAWHFTIPIALLGGTNSFTWSYAVNQPITAVDREAWGIDNVQVTSTVPEPATLLLIGFGAAAAAASRRRRPRP